MSVPDTKHVLELARRIEEAKAELSLLEGKWAALFASSPENTVSSRGGRKADPEGPSARVLETIESEPQRTWRAEAIVDATGIDRKKVEKALYNLCAARKISRAGRGLYAANAMMERFLSPPAESAAA